MHLSYLRNELVSSLKHAKQAWNKPPPTTDPPDHATHTKSRERALIQTHPNASRVVRSRGSLVSQSNQCIEAKFVTKSYGKTVALDDVSFSIPCGERYAPLGPNRTGKSTTLRLLVGLLKPGTGRIKSDGHEPFSPEAKSVLGYLPEDATPYRTLSVRENLEYIAALRGVKDAANAADRFLDDLNLREYERAKVGKLSRGNMQNSLLWS